MQARAVQSSDDGASARASIPTEAEIDAAFGVPLGDRGVQPVWLELRNATGRPFVFLPAGLDPEYFSPREVAYLFERRADGALAERLDRLAFDVSGPVAPGETRSGFVFVNRANPTVVLQIDLVGERWSRRLELLAPTPGASEGLRRFEALKARLDAGPTRDLATHDALRQAIAELPCCMRAGEDSADAAPLNLALVGTLEDVAAAFARRGYRHGPAPDARVFGRAPDIAARLSSRWTPARPHVVRLWATPLRWRGLPVMIAQASMPAGGRFGAAPGAGDDPDMDRARDDVLEDLLVSQGVAQVGFVAVVGDPPRADGPRQAYRTDGLRAVAVFGDRPTSLAEIRFFDWERPAFRAADATPPAVTGPVRSP